MATMMNKDLDFLFSQFPANDYTAIYGEWCGGNIQKGVVPKFSICSMLNSSTTAQFITSACLLPILCCTLFFFR